MPPRDRCRFCNLLDDASNLIDACDCYKKRDSGRFHTKCLEAYISRWEHDYRSNPDRSLADARAGLHCPGCGKRFRVRLGFRESTKFFWTKGSIHAYGEAVFIGVMTLMVFYALALTFASARTQEELRDDEVILGPLIVVVLAVVFLSFRSMYKKWKHAQVEAVVTSVV